MRSMLEHFAIMPRIRSGRDNSGGPKVAPVAETPRECAESGLPIPTIHRVADRYGADVLANNPHERGKVRSVEQSAEIGLVVEDPSSGYVGAVVRVEATASNSKTVTAVSGSFRWVRIPG